MPTTSGAQDEEERGNTERVNAAHRAAWTEERLYCDEGRQPPPGVEIVGPQWSGCGWVWLRFEDGVLVASGESAKEVR